MSWEERTQVLPIQVRCTLRRVNDSSSSLVNPTLYKHTSMRMPNLLIFKSRSHFNVPGEIRDRVSTGQFFILRMLKDINFINMIIKTPLSKPYQYCLNECKIIYFFSSPCNHLCYGTNRTMIYVEKDMMTSSNIWMWYIHTHKYQLKKKHPAIRQRMHHVAKDIRNSIFCICTLT